MNVDIIGLLETMAEHGTAPSQGCSLFGASNVDAIERLKNTYLIKRFNQGRSAQKYVVGPFGSGKTHFLRQLMETAAGLDCVTAEVSLNKDVDFTQSLIVYKEIAQALRTPQGGRGLESLILAALEQVKGKAPTPASQEIFLDGWVSGLDKVDFVGDSFGRVLQQATQAHLQDNSVAFSQCCKWLKGDISDKALSKELGVPIVVKSEYNLFAKRLMLSVFQFVKHAGFRGTVLCYDEAEQGLNVDRKRTEKILSMLQGEINSITTLDNSSALLVYALTPDLISKMETFAALQQRIADPGPGLGFFDGNTLAPLIDLTRRKDPVDDLKVIGQKLLELCLSHVNQGWTLSPKALAERVDEIATAVAMEDLSASNRRSMVKRTCTTLLSLLPAHEYVASTKERTVEEEDEV